MEGYCEKHERPYQFFCICGDWRYECPQCRYEGVYDTIATTQTKINPANEWTTSDKVEGTTKQMASREKVIKELHDARRYLEDKEWSDRGASPHIDAINDAIILLKEQEDGLKHYDDGSVEP